MKTNEQLLLLFTVLLCVDFLCNTRLLVFTIKSSRKLRVCFSSYGYTISKIFVWLVIFLCFAAEKFDLKQYTLNNENNTSKFTLFVLSLPFPEQWSSLSKEDIFKFSKVYFHILKADVTSY